MLSLQLLRMLRKNEFFQGLAWKRTITENLLRIIHVFKMGLRSRHDKYEQFHSYRNRTTVRSYKIRMQMRTS